MMRSALLLVSAIAATGCGAHYAFVPVSPPAHVVPAYDRDAAYYAIPEQNPHGDLRVLSYGLEKLAEGDPDSPSDDDPEMETLHLRVLVENNGSSRWTFDTREQQIALDGVGVESPAYAVSDHAGDGSTPPTLNLTSGATRIVDLFYLLPPGTDGSALPAFRALTLVHTDDGAALVTTPFARVDVSIFSPYVQPENVADGSYDYLDEPFWGGGGDAGRASRRRVYSRGRGLGQSSSGPSHGRTHTGGGRSRGSSRRGGGGGRSHGGGRH